MTELEEITGVGPKTAEKLREAGFKTAEDLAKATPETVIEKAGIGKTTAPKIIKNAQKVTTVASEIKQETPKPSKKEKTTQPKAEIEQIEVIEEQPKPTKKQKKKKVEKTLESEAERSPMPQGIPTKKKRGIQVRSLKEERGEESRIPAEKREGWIVQSRELSEEEKEAKRERQERLAQANRITRKIPEPPKPVKSIRTKKAKETVKPVRQEREKKTVKKLTKKTIKKVEYYTTEDLPKHQVSIRKRGISAKSSGVTQPRSNVPKNSALGKISSPRRSRRVIHQKQVIVQLNDEFDSDRVLGQKIYFTYPNSNKKVPGSVARRFGKAKSKKVIVNFNKGIRPEGINQIIYTK